MGWLLEVIGKLIEKKRFINRGFLIGPICPIYGHGALLIIFLLSKYKSNIFILFGMSILICSILEYFTSFIMEKIFKTRWWDYSTKKFNINGRICLDTMIPFAIFGCIVIYIINPFFIDMLNLVSTKTINIVSIILFILYLIDISISTKIIYNFRSTITNAEKDATEEITKRVRRIISRRGLLYKRLINAYPNMKSRKEILLILKNKIEKDLRNYNEK